MLNYYDEIKNDILEVLEEDEGAKNILHSENCKDTIIENLVDYLIDCDDVTGSGSGSYYFNSKKARMQCYNYASDVREALEMYGYRKTLEKFKIFEALSDRGCIDVENMTFNNEILEEVGDDEKYYIFYALEEIDGLDFEAIDVITRCYKLYEVVTKIVENFLKYGFTK
jgi:hypothetical protein